MASRNPPPWRNERSNLPQRHAPAPTVPAKRSANERTHDSRGAKRPNTTNAAEEEWVAGENRFVLAQSKKKAALRVKGGRAKPIDWLAVTLRFVDPTKEPGDDEVDDEDLEVVDPEGVLEGLDAAELSALEKEIEHFLTLETNRSNCDYWTVRRHDIYTTSKANLTVPQSHLQRPSPQSKKDGGRARHQLRGRRH
jgi:hypothetical protein